MKNYLYQRELIPDPNSEAMAARMPKTKAMFRQYDKATELARPKERRNFPENARGAYDMPEYKGLVVQKEFFETAHEDEHWKCVRAKQIYEDILSSPGQKDLPAKQKMNGELQLQGVKIKGSAPHHRRKSSAVTQTSPSRSRRPSSAPPFRIRRCKTLAKKPCS